MGIIIYYGKYIFIYYVIDEFKRLFILLVGYILIYLYLVWNRYIKIICN